MEKIHKFIECYLPVTSCNLYCNYCYVIAENRRAMEITPLDYSLETMKRAMTKERFGGTCYFSMCGAGETLLPEYALDIVDLWLKNGHFVNVTTNGTISKRFDEIIERFSKEELNRLHISFSLHFLELKRLNLITTFFENIKKVAQAGVSYIVQINMCDEYMPYINEIKEISIRNVGFPPQVAVTRKETGVHPKMNISLRTEKTKAQYIEAGRKFDSPLFEFTLKNFLVKRKEFCYAGDWAYQLNLKSGLLKRCYKSCVVQNIFKDIEKPIFELPVGHHCNDIYCQNSSHFMSLGVIPELDTPTYCALRDRGEVWYTEEMRSFLSGKLADTNQTCSGSKRIKVFFVGIYDKFAYRAYVFLERIKKKYVK